MVWQAWIAAVAVAAGSAVAAPARADGPLQAPEQGASWAAGIQRARQQLRIGDRVGAVRTLRAVIPQMEHSAPREDQLVADALLGRAYQQLGQFGDAEPVLRRALVLAQDGGRADQVAGVLNQLGLLHAAVHDEDAALSEFSHGLEAARKANDAEASVEIMLNLGQLHVQRKESAEAIELLGRAARELRNQPPSAGKARLLTAVSIRLMALDAAAQDKAVQELEGDSLDEARREAATSSDLRVESEALGESGHLYELLKDRDRALLYSRRAIFAAQAAQVPELLYKWEWQAARQLRAQGRADDATEFYRHSVATLSPIRHDLLLELRGTGQSYRGTIGPLFLEFADLLLSQSAQVGDSLRTARLLEAREVVEQLKTVELEDYFHESCAARFQEKQHNIDGLASGTAVIYTIILPDRLELLITAGGRIDRVAVDVPEETLADEAVTFRKLLMKRSTEQYLQHGQRLYGWLIRPVLEQLKDNQVDTLVVVPDGPLLGIPFAALHDGQDFLVQHFAVATIPGLHLVDPRAQGSVSARALLGGLSQAVQGYPALPGVEDELHDVAQLYNAQLLDNQQFTMPKVEQAVDSRPFSVVHIASHGMFDREASKSFVLTYDGHIDMDGLERIVKAHRAADDPVDLLTLSACETAAGDDRSALGLAGVAIKAGARSVLATLWFVDDAASSSLVRDFYRQLGSKKGQSKAKALREAQLHLLADPHYRHPGYWAPFLMIGNWT